MFGFRKKKKKSTQYSPLFLKSVTFQKKTFYRPVTFSSRHRMLFFVSYGV